MANYVKATDFAGKDSLASGTPAKLVKGTEIDVEFNAIASAITSKADADSPTLTGTPLAPTASSVTNNTQIATTAFVQSLISSAITTAKAALYPVGSIYVNATNNTNPGTLLGFGTWVAFGAGRVPVGFDSSDPLFDTAEETGGSKDAIVVLHTHTATVTDPAHNHTGSAGSPVYVGTGVIGNVPAGGSTVVPIGNSTLQSASTGISVTNANTGSSGTNANLQPYITVYMWKRTA